MSGNFFSDVGLIFFVSWTFVLTKLVIAAFGRELIPWRVKNSEPQSHRGNYSRHLSR